MKSKSKLRSRGRCTNTFELVETVLYSYHRTKQNLAQIAKAVQVSERTVAKIVDGNFIVELMNIGTGDSTTAEIKWVPDSDRYTNYEDDITVIIDGKHETLVNTIRRYALV